MTIHRRVSIVPLRALTTHPPSPRVREIATRSLSLGVFVGFTALAPPTSRPFDVDARVDPSRSIHGESPSRAPSHALARRRRRRSPPLALALSPGVTLVDAFHPPLALGVRGSPAHRFRSAPARSHRRRPRVRRARRRRPSFKRLVVNGRRPRAKTRAKARHGARVVDADDSTFRRFPGSRLASRSRARRVRESPRSVDSAKTMPVAAADAAAAVDDDARRSRVDDDVGRVRALDRPTRVAIASHAEARTLADVVRALVENVVDGDATRAEIEVTIASSRTGAERRRETRARASSRATTGEDGRERNCARCAIVSEKEKENRLFPSRSARARGARFSACVEAWRSSVGPEGARRRRD